MGRNKRLPVQEDLDVVFGLFWPLFNFKLEGYIPNRPLRVESKIGDGRSNNRQKLLSTTVFKLYGIVYGLLFIPYLLFATPKDILPAERSFTFSSAYFLSQHSACSCTLPKVCGNFCNARGQKISPPKREELGHAQHTSEQIPKEDRQILSDFFRGLVTQGVFASTLFGYKPACSFDYLHFCVFDPSHPLKTRYLIECYGWRTWEKYRKLFDIKNFLIINCDRKFPSILFVHKEKMVAVLKQYRSFFCDFFDRDPLLEELEGFLTRAFQLDLHRKDFHKMQGLLFGYDLKNCTYFQHRYDIEGTLSYFPYELPFDLQVTADHLLDEPDLIGQCEYFNQNFSFKRIWTSSNPFFSTGSYGYMSFDDISDFRNAEYQKKIIDLYNSDQFLEDFLTILCN